MTEEYSNTRTFDVRFRDGHSIRVRGDYLSLTGDNYTILAYVLKKGSTHEKVREEVLAAPRDTIQYIVDVFLSQEPPSEGDTSK